MKGRAMIGIAHRQPAAHQTLQDILQPLGVQVQSFSTAAEVLNCPKLCQLSSLILQLEVDHRSFDILDTLKSRVPLLPTIVVCRSPNLEFAVSVMKHGAMDMLVEPLNALALRESVSIALQRHRRLSSHCAEFAIPTDEWELLTSQERDVVKRIAGGESIRRIAARMDVSERTVHIRRKSAMDKLGAANRAELLAAAHKLFLLEEALQQGLDADTNSQSHSQPVRQPCSSRIRAGRLPVGVPC